MMSGKALTNSMWMYPKNKKKLAANSLAASCSLSNFVSIPFRIDTPRMDYFAVVITQVSTVGWVGPP
jgi:hypothetical protein